jgi:hypothetical protein
MLFFKPPLVNDFLSSPAMGQQPFIDYTVRRRFEFSLDRQRIDRTRDFAHQLSSLGSSLISGCENELNFPFMPIISLPCFCARVKLRVASMMCILKKISLLGEDGDSGVLRHNDVLLCLMA